MPSLKKLFKKKKEHKPIPIVPYEELYSSGVLQRPPPDRSPPPPPLPSAPSVNEGHTLSPIMSNGPSGSALPSSAAAPNPVTHFPAPRTRPSEPALRSRAHETREVSVFDMDAAYNRAPTPETSSARMSSQELLAGVDLAFRESFVFPSRPLEPTPAPVSAPWRPYGDDLYTLPPQARLPPVQRRPEVGPILPLSSPRRPRTPSPPPPPSHPLLVRSAVALETPSPPPNIPLPSLPPPPPIPPRNPARLLPRERR